jgi:hypothetical protein
MARGLPGVVAANAGTNVIASEAKQSIEPQRKNGLLRRFAPRNDGVQFQNMTPRSRGAMRLRVIASEAKQSISRRKGRMDCFVAFAPRNDVAQFPKTRLRHPAARCARGFALNSCPKNSEGAGNAGRAMRPRPRMQNRKAYEHSHHGHTGTTRHSPRNGFTAYFALSSVTTLV